MHFKGSLTAALAQSLCAPNPFFMPVSTKPLWGLCYHRLSSIRMSPVRYMIPTFRATVTNRQGYMKVGRRFSCFRGYQQENVPSLLNSNSPRPTSRFDTSPVSFGVWGWKGYDALILPGTSLPCRATAIFGSEFDHVEHDVLRICFCPPLHGRFKVIAKLLVPGIQRAEKKDTRMTLVMNLERDLTGSLTARFTPQEKKKKGEVFTEFDGREAGVHKRDNVIMI